MKAIAAQMGRQRGLCVGVILSVLVLAAASCGGPSFSQETTTVLDRALDTVMDSNEIPGAVAGVWAPSRGSWFVAKGEADVQAGTPMKTSDEFRIASVTKTFTATMVLILADEGELSLDDKLSEYLPEIANSENITIRQLLNHTSGIRDEDPTGAWAEYFARTDRMLKKWTPMEVYQAYTGGQVQEEPGEWEYSNAGYVVLGMVIEKVSGTSVPDFCEAGITGPLGLEDTYFPEGPEITGEYTHGYDGSTDVTRMDMSWDFTAGAMISTASDLKVWSKAFATGELLSPETRKQQNTFVDIPGGGGNAKEGLGPEYFYGWLGHAGANIGYQCEMWYYPEEGATVVVMMNKLSSDESDLGAATKAWMQLADTVFPGILPAPHG
jgi:D-alanyl-D-alanine carboxypeptidase